MNYSAKNLISLLERNGYFFKRANGSYHLFQTKKVREELYRLLAKEFGYFE